jgi:hypothetical protein
VAEREPPPGRDQPDAERAGPFFAQRSLNSLLKLDGKSLQLLSDLEM